MTASLQPLFLSQVAEHFRPVSPETDATTALISRRDLRPMRHLRTVPIVQTELRRVAPSLPVLFEQGPSGLLPVALLRLEDADDSAVIPESGLWAGGYLPGALRLAPLYCRPDGPAPRLLIDPTSPLVGRTGEDGQIPLFDKDGQPSEAHDRIMAYFRVYHRELLSARRATRGLERNGLLCPARRVADLDHPAFDRHLTFDQAALDCVSIPALKPLVGLGALEMGYLQAFSLDQIPRLRAISRKLAHRPQQSDLPAASPQEDLGGFLDSLASQYQREREAKTENLT